MVLNCTTKQLLCFFVLKDTKNTNNLPNVFDFFYFTFRCEIGFSECQKYSFFTVGVFLGDYITIIIVAIFQGLPVIFILKIDYFFLFLLKLVINRWK